MSLMQRQRIDCQMHTLADAYISKRIHRGSDLLSSGVIDGREFDLCVKIGDWDFEEEMTRGAMSIITRWRSPPDR
jgi:hypothetical protein